MIPIVEPVVSCSLPRDALDASQREAMLALLAAHFSGVDAGQFAADLEEKNHVILLERGGRLVGFTTLLAYETNVAGETVSVVCSGDTIVSPEAWGSPVLARAWISTVNRLRQDYPRGRYYWLLLTSGFRTYRFLPVFWREFYPRCDRPTPPATQALLDRLAWERFGPLYNPGTGLVRFPRPQRLRPDLANAPEERLENSHIGYFFARNPGHIHGDELVCLTELSPSNLTPAGQRMVVRPAG